MTDASYKDRMPIFFMHIAKTAGSYVNSVFRNALGDNHVVLHAENRIGNTEDLNAARADDRHFISGHIPNSLWNAIAGNTRNAFFSFTVIRDPIDHLASHIRWLDHYNLEAKRTEFNLLDKFHQDLVRRIGSTDLDNPASLDDFLTNLPPLGFRLLDNCQSRYLLGSGGAGFGASYPLSLGSAASIRDGIAQFDRVFTQCDMGQVVRQLGSDLSLPLEPLAERVNAAKSPRKVNTKNPIIRQILGKRLTVDSWLWRYVTGQP